MSNFVSLVTVDIFSVSLADRARERPPSAPNRAMIIKGGRSLRKPDSSTFGKKLPRLERRYSFSMDYRTFNEHALYLSRQTRDTLKETFEATVSNAISNDLMTPIIISTYAPQRDMVASVLKKRERQEHRQKDKSSVLVSTIKSSAKMKEQQRRRLSNVTKQLKTEESVKKSSRALDTILEVTDSPPSINLRNLTVFCFF